jgi:3-hydroxyacyl-CoA dehydrogenase
LFLLVRLLQAAGKYPDMKFPIHKVAILGSGIMGSRIACLFAGIGIPVLLLDRATPETSSGDTPKKRNALVNDALKKALQNPPSPIYSFDAAKLIITGNFEDDMSSINGCDWIIEVIVEKPDAKAALYEQVEKFRRAGTLITTNTSGIPVNLFVKGRSEDFQKHFCGTHFFNPPRYLQLLEIIPTRFTDPSVIDTLMQFGDLHLGKTTILCKDTPGFVANRIGTHAFLSILHAMETSGLSVDEVDALTGQLIGRSKSATFRTADIVGLDTLAFVAKGLYQFCTDDESREQLVLPSWIEKMLQQQWLGDKTAQGFYKKAKDASGKKIFLSINAQTLEYEAPRKTRFAAVDAVKNIDDIHERIKVLLQFDDQAGAFLRDLFYRMFSYASHRVPGVADNVHALDAAIKAGFGWELGIFETWDLLGVHETVSAMKAQGHVVAAWVEELIYNGNQSFYKVVDGKPQAYAPASHDFIPTLTKAQERAFVVMRNFQAQKIWQNTASKVYHLGDDVVGLEWHTKMGSIGAEVLEGMQTAIGIAEKKFKGLVIANDGPNFSAGANVGMILMLAMERKHDQLEQAIRIFQDTMMKVRYSAVPVVIAPHALSLGGACEMSLHADRICASAETYMGLVEMGIGVIPGGGGTKEFVLRAADEMHEGEPETITLKKRFETIALAKVSTSAQEAFDLGIFRKGHDLIVMNPNRRIGEAKQSVLSIFEEGYRKPLERKEVKVLGRSGLGTLLAGVHIMETSGYATAHEALVARKLAHVMCGGDLSETTLVTEQYLLELEREAFLSLCTEPKSLERMQSVLKGGKPIRN